MTRLLVGLGLLGLPTTEAFGSFVRGDEARTRDGAGAGLGLAIAQGLVAAHDGHISAVPGPGGRVEVELPAVP